MPIRQTFAPADLIGFIVEPQIALRLNAEKRRGIGSPARPDQGVSCMKLVPEPGRELTAVQAVQPQRNRPQFDRDRVEVDPEAVPVGDIGTDPLLLEDDVLLRNGPARLLLLALQV